MQPFIQSKNHPVFDQVGHKPDLHMFCYPMGTKVKFGWNFREVDYVEQIGGHNKLGQRGKD